MKRTFIFAAILMMGIAGQAQQSIDMNVVRKAMKQQHAMNSRNDIAPIKATYNVNNDGTLVEYRDDFVYDEWEYFLTQKSTSVMNNGEWQRYLRTDYEVDWNYCPVEVTTLKWNDGYWYNDTRITCEYDEVGFVPIIREEVHEQWVENDWMNVNKYIYDYDPIVSIIIKDWNGSTWENHYLYTMESALNETTVLLQYWQGGAWQNQEKAIYHYHTNGNEDFITFMEWVSGAWVNHERHTYEYDGQNRLTKIYKRGWENGNWSNTNYQTLNYTNDGMGNSSEALCRATGNANPNTDLTMYYNEGESIDYENVHQITMEYIDLTAIHETEATSRFSVYPNPAGNTLVIRGEQFQKAELYNLAGQKVIESESPSLEWKNLSSGAYLLKIHRTDGIVETQKVLVR